MRLLGDPGKSRETATATEAAEAIAVATRGMGQDLLILRRTDEGEGTLEALGDGSRHPGLIPGNSASMLRTP